MDVTDEMRMAVYAADCEATGHDIDNVNTLLRMSDLAGPDDDTLPHLTCNRCRQVWVLAADPGADYPDAVAKEKARVKDPDRIKPRRRPAKRRAG